MKTYTFDVLPKPLLVLAELQAVVKVTAMGDATCDKIQVVAPDSGFDIIGFENTKGGSCVKITGSSTPAEPSGYKGIQIGNMTESMPRSAYRPTRNTGKPEITITCPVGTSLWASSVDQLESKGLGGELQLFLSNHEAAVITDAEAVIGDNDVQEITIGCREFSTAVIHNARGTLDLLASQDSHIVISGLYQNVFAKAEGNAVITIFGNCEGISGSAASTATIQYLGNCGQSNITGGSDTNLFVSGS